MADSSRVQISYLKQTELGTIPSSPFQIIRHTGGSFGAPTDVQRSDEIRGDAQRGAAVRTGINPQATLNLEFSAKTFDDLIEGFLRSSWSTPVDVSETVISADKTNSQFVSSAVETLDWTAKGITVGQWVYVDGFDESGANGWFKVTSISDVNLGVTPSPENDDNDVDPNTISVEGAYIRNGIAAPYFAFQLQHLDLTDKFKLIEDARIGEMGLEVNARGMVTGSFNIMGRKFSLAAAGAGDGETTDAETTEILNTIDHTKKVIINGDSYDGCIQSYSLQGNMNPRRIDGIGQLYSCDIGLGSLDLSGSLSVYLSDTSWDDMLQKYVDFTKISIAFEFQDSEGNGYIYELPVIALTNEPGNVPGPDNDVLLNMDYQAESGLIGEETKTIQICRRRAA